MRDASIRLLLLDNYDSFTYNLYHYLEPHCGEIQVHRNDAISLQEIESFTHIVLSPGPGLPKDAGILMQVLENYAHKKPILGVCLGLQAIAEFYGGNLYNLREVMHGRQVQVIPEKHSRFFGTGPVPFAVGLYHSWAVEASSLPNFLQVNALSESGVVMGIEHQTLPVFGLQFHPESILTEGGKELLTKWLVDGKESPTTNQ